MPITQYAGDQFIPVIGREEDLKKLANKIGMPKADEAIKVCAIHGEAGVGKTTFTWKFLSNKFDEGIYSSVLWIKKR